MFNRFFNFKSRLFQFRPRWLLDKIKLRSSRLPKGMTAKQRGLVYFFALGFCAAAAVSAGALTVLYNDPPGLRNLDGSHFRGNEIVVLDPSRREEHRLGPGRLFERPMALVHSGVDDILLRVALQEEMLALRRAADGTLVVAAHAHHEPRPNDVPRTVTQQEALQMLIDAEFVRRGSSWEQALESRVPARRLPDSNNEGGRIIVFEHRVLAVNEDAEDLPDISALPLEDLEHMGLATASYEFMGFFLIPSEEEDGPSLYQPLRLTAEEDSLVGAPAIAQIEYEYYEWVITHSAPRNFGEPAQHVNIRTADTLRHVSEWTEPENAWFFDDDGWIYYGNALPPGLMTPLLMESFSVSPDSELDPEESRYRLYLTYQHAPLDFDTVNDMWNRGRYSVSNEAGRILADLLGL